MTKKPLPQFNSLAEAKAYYNKYGKLSPPFGRIGPRAEYNLYLYHVIDGRVMRLLITNDGKVEQLIIPPK